MLVVKQESVAAAKAALAAAGEAGVFELGQLVARGAGEPACVLVD